jgi:hypothetical protein
MYFHISSGNACTSNIVLKRQTSLSNCKEFSVLIMDNLKSNTLPTIRGSCHCCGSSLLYYHDDKGNYLFTGEKNTVLGCHADSTKNNCVVVGCGSYSKHDNAIVIGTDKVSHQDNSITLGDILITDTGIKLNADTVIITKEQNMNDDYLKNHTFDHTNNGDKCIICEKQVTSGLLHRDENNITEVLCFSCLFYTMKKIHRAS